jgi:GntR family transcriptional regulator
MKDLDPNIGIPKSRQLATILRAQIRSGEIPPHHAIPSGRTLRETYGIANSTIGKAIAILKEEGLIRTEDGMGLYVTDRADWKSAP